MKTIKENKIEAYTVAIGNFSIPLTKDQEKVMKIIEECDGFLGLHPHYPDGTLLLFDTRNNAVGCKNILDFEGVQTGRNIVKVYIDKKYEKKTH